MTTRPLIVEFVGPPGAGKSTLARRLERRLPNARRHRGLRGFPVRGRFGLELQRDLQRLRVLARYPGIGRAVVRARDRERFRLLARAARYEQCRRELHSSASIDLLEEGPLLGLAALAAHTGLVLGAGRITRPDLVVHVAPPSEVCRERLRARPETRDIDALSDAQLDELFDRYATAFTHLLDAIDVPIVEVEGAVAADVKAVEMALARYAVPEVDSR